MRPELCLKFCFVSRFFLISRWRSGFKTNAPNSRSSWNRAAAQLTPTRWPLAADCRAALPRWHLCGARRPPWRLRWGQPGPTSPVTPRGTLPHTKSLCNSHSWCEERPQLSAVDGASGAAYMAARRQLSTDGSQKQQQLRRFAAASWHCGFIPENENQGRDWNDCRGAEAQRAQGQHVPDTQRKPSTKGSFIGCSLSPVCHVFVSVLMWLPFHFLFLPPHPFVMLRPVWRWPEISPRLLTVQCRRAHMGREGGGRRRGYYKPNIRPTDSTIRLLEAQRALCNASTSFYVVYMYLLFNLNYWEAFFPPSVEISLCSFCKCLKRYQQRRAVNAALTQAKLFYAVPRCYVKFVKGLRICCLKGKKEKKKERRCWRAAICHWILCIIFRFVCAVLDTLWNRVFLGLMYCPDVFSRHRIYLVLYWSL